MKTREEIITSMCYTWRHDFGLNKSQQAYPFQAGMTEQERKDLWNQFAQIYDNDIAPLIEESSTLNEELNSGDKIVLPKNREHAEMMIRVAQFYLNTSN